MGRSALLLCLRRRNKMSYLEDKLIECRELIKMNKEFITKYPDDYGLKLGLCSLEAHRKELLEKIERGE
jgi:hypothetical protein